MKKVIIVLDDKSKQTVKVDNSILNATDIKIVNSLFEIEESSLDEERTVILFDGFTKQWQSVSVLKMFAQLMKLNFVFISADGDFNFAMQPLGRIYVAQTSVIDFELIQAAVYSDDSHATTDLVYSGSECADLFLQGQYGKEVRGLAEAYLALLQREDLLQQRIAKQQEEYELLLNQRNLLEAENQKWSNGCKILVNRAKALNNALERYEVALSQDFYNKASLNKYQSRPDIVYLKVFSDFDGLDLLLETLVDAFRMQGDKSVKVVRLFDSSGNRKIRLLPQYYHRLRNRYDVREVINNDFLCKSGDYNNLMGRLLTNKYGLNVLIVVDEKDNDDVIFSGSYLQYNLCKRVQDAEILGLAQNTTVVNEVHPNWLNWQVVDLSGYSKKEAFLKLSSRKVVQNAVTTAAKYTSAF